MTLDPKTMKLVALAVDESTTEEERRTAAVFACRQIADRMKLGPYRTPVDHNGLREAAHLLRRVTKVYRDFLKGKSREKRFIISRPEFEGIVTLLDEISDVLDTLT